MTGVVRTGGAKSEEFEMHRGVKQGDSLSPLLFIIYMDQILKQCKKRTRRVKIGNMNMRPVYTQTLVYADDIVLLANSIRLVELCL